MLHLQCYGREARQEGRRFFHILPQRDGLLGGRVALYPASGRDRIAFGRSVHVQLLQVRSYGQYPGFAERRGREPSDAADDGLLSVRHGMEPEQSEQEQVPLFG